MPCTEWLFDVWAFVRPTRPWFWLALLPLTACGVEPQRFDYWVLALSWSPQYCAETNRPEPLQCGDRRYGFIVHGLWPQNERGYPRDCPRPARLPRSTIDRMLPLMPSPGLIQHEWNKHGACTGWPANHYFDAVEDAYSSVRIPARYQNLNQYLSTDVRKLEGDFITANPGHTPQSIASICSGNYLKEIRVCMDQAFKPRACGPDVRDRCKSSFALRPAK